MVVGGGLETAVANIKSAQKKNRQMIKNRARNRSVMSNLRTAFNPEGRLSPAKMLPTAGACGLEQRSPGRHAAM